MALCRILLQCLVFWRHSGDRWSCKSYSLIDSKIESSYLYYCCRLKSSMATLQKCLILSRLPSELGWQCTKRTTKRTTSARWAASSCSTLPLTLGKSTSTRDAERSRAWSRNPNVQKDTATLTTCATRSPFLNCLWYFFFKRDVN